MYKGWPARLQPSIEVCAIQLPGRGSRIGERPFVHLDPLLDALHGALEPYLDRPFALFGHSMGALVAFELARRLRDAAGPQPLQLFVSGRAAPGSGPARIPLHRLPDDAFMEQVRRLNGTPQSVLESRELLELLVPVLRADFQVVETWRHRPAERLRVPIIALGGSEDQTASPASVHAWHAHTSRSFASHLVSGGHFFLSSAEPQVAALVAHALAPETLARSLHGNQLSTTKSPTSAVAPDLLRAAASDGRGGDR